MYVIYYIHIITICATVARTICAASFSVPLKSNKTSPIADQPLMLEEPLPPILPIQDGHDHLLPSLGEQSDSKKPIIGRPDGHENHSEQNLLGAPDGHEDHRDKPLIGARDGHDDRQTQPLLGAPDGHDSYTGHPLIGKPDGHDDFSEKSEESSNPVAEYYELHTTNDEFDYNEQILYDDGLQTIEEFNDDEPLVRCKRPMCLIFCAHGYQADSTGCPLCQCLEDPCEGVTCDEGLSCRAQGCERGEACVSLTHSCAGDPSSLPAVCAIPMCSDNCEHGYQNDKRGCMTCDCVTAPESVNASPVAQQCPEIECLATCSVGYRFDEHGCMTCDCLTKICAEPMCATDCVNGYKHDADGCMTCDCHDSPSPLEHHDVSACAIPMCTAKCDYGYKMSAAGCMTCDCSEPLGPVEVATDHPCETLTCTTLCTAGYKIDARECLTCDCNEPLLAEIEKQPCAMPMCTARCDYGYKYNAHGCKTCDCQGTPCGEKQCEMGQICQNRTIKYQDTQICIPKPLCHTERENHVQFNPECESNGVYKPRQCDKFQGDCWCVDDAGKEIDGTRTIVYTEEQKPDCKRNITVLLTVYLSLTIPMKDHLEQGSSLTSEQLKSDLREHASAWLMIHEDYITVQTVDKVNGLPTDTYSIMILARRDDGWCDLASAAEHMKLKFYRGDCNVPINHVTLTPIPRSLKIVQQFSHPTQNPNFLMAQDSIKHQSNDWKTFCATHSYLVIAAATVATLFLLTILILSVQIMRRRSRTGEMNFRHQPLVSQISTSSEKCLLNGPDDCGVVLLSNEPINEKMALA